MKDSMGRLPAVKSRREALVEVVRIASDKRGHVMLTDHCEWLELKLRAIRLIAKRGLKAASRDLP